MSFYDKVRTQKFLSFSLILFTLAIGVLIGTEVQTGAKAAKEQTIAPDATPLVIPSPVLMQNEFSKIAKRLEPSVVNISTKYTPKKEVTQARPRNNMRRQPVPQDDQDDQADGGIQQYMQRFFNGFGGGGGGAIPFGQPDDTPSAALGSGVVVDRNGYILTNNHVVEKATKITVRFTNDETEYPAHVIGTDTDTDLAVIKVDKKNLIPAKIGNSDALQVGDWAMAIGSPLGFQSTVTVGIVSALARDIPGEARGFQHFIQTDAAINPGNSGGPLLNMNGEVIGINTMIATRSGGYQGLGFAMPINTAVKTYNEIIREGHVTRGSIGAHLQEVNESTLKIYGGGATHGVAIGEVVKDSPADKAGLQEEDIITAINGKAIAKSQDVIDIISDSPVGSTVKVSIVRKGKPETMTVSIGDRTKIYAKEYGLAEPTVDTPEGTHMKFGITLQTLRQSERDQMKLKGNTGVLVSSVEPDSFADDIGLARGDVITELNRQPVTSTEDVKRIQSSLKPGDAAAFRVLRSTGGSGGGSWQPLLLGGKVPDSN